MWWQRVRIPLAQLIGLDAERIVVDHAHRHETGGRSDLTLLRPHGRNRQELEIS
jgi:hypothetical protein